MTKNSLYQKRQFRKLRRIVRYAYQNSNFYRNLYDTSGFHPDNLQSFSDLNEIPMITRNDLKKVLEDNPDDLYTSHIRRSDWSQQTSGSSGIPIKIIASRFERLRLMLIMVQIYRLAGMRLFDQVVVIKDPIDIRKHSLVERIGIMRHDYYSIYQPIESIISSLKERIRRVDILKSMPSDLANLVYTASRDGVNVQPPRVIFSDSETLDSANRSAIEKYFKVPLLDFYANTETGIAAFQTSSSNGRYLIPTNSVIFETIPSDLLGANEYEIVLTGLINKTTPIIRYRIGDLSDGPVELPNSTCSFASVGGIHGKYLDFLLKNDGTVVSSHAAKQNLTHLPGIKRFQISQGRIGSLKVTIEPSLSWRAETVNVIKEQFLRDFGPDTEIELVLVEDLSKSITMDKKFKVVHSLVAQELLSKSNLERN